MLERRFGVSNLRREGPKKIRYNGTYIWQRSYITLLLDIQYIEWLLGFLMVRFVSWLWIIIFR